MTDCFLLSLEVSVDRTQIQNWLAKLLQSKTAACECQGDDTVQDRLKRHGLRFGRFPDG